MNNQFFFDANDGKNPGTIHFSGNEASATTSVSSAAEVVILGDDD